MRMSEQQKQIKSNNSLTSRRTDGDKKNQERKKKEKEKRNRKRKKLDDHSFEQIEGKVDIRYVAMCNA